MRIERVPIGMETLGEAREQAERMSKLVRKAVIGAYRDPQYATGWYVRVVVDRQVIARLVSREEVDRFLEGYVSTATAPSTDGPGAYLLDEGGGGGVLLRSPPRCVGTRLCKWAVVAFPLPCDNVTSIIHLQDTLTRTLECASARRHSGRRVRPSRTHTARDGRR